MQSYGALVPVLHLESGMRLYPTRRHLAPPTAPGLLHGSLTVGKCTFITVNGTAGIGASPDCAGDEPPGAAGIGDARGDRGTDSVGQRPHPQRPGQEPAILLERWLRLPRSVQQLCAWVRRHE